MELKVDLNGFDSYGSPFWIDFMIKPTTTGNNDLIPTTIFLYSNKEFRSLNCSAYMPGLWLTPFNQTMTIFVYAMETKRLYQFQSLVCVLIIIIFFVADNSTLSRIHCKCAPKDIACYWYQMKIYQKSPSCKYVQLNVDAHCNYSPINT